MLAFASKSSIHHIFHAYPLIIYLWHHLLVLVPCDWRKLILEGCHCVFGLLCCVVVRVVDEVEMGLQNLKYGSDGN